VAELNTGQSGTANAGEGAPPPPAVIRAVVFTDNDVLREAYRDILERVTEPAIVSTFVASADEALRAVEPQAGPAVVLLLDITPATADVRKLAKEVKRRRPTCQIILVSDRLTEHEAWKLRHEGLDEVLLKPLEEGELAKAMSGLRTTWPVPELKGDEAIFIERMDIASRIQHMVLLVCFALLCLTGFPLLFPDSHAFETLFFFSSSPFEMRAMLHRFAAVGLIILSLYHLYYLIFTPAGRQDFRDIRPGKKDLTDLLDTVKYNLGLRKEPPDYARFSVFEKLEYGGAFWGTFIMILTGILLWEKSWTLSFVPLWFLDVIRVVHRYEAILALGFVIIWHLYSVSLKMGVFVHGKITLKEMKEEYAAWYREYARQQLGSETPRKK
jgi:formate dehydrogenase gamma subunit